MPSRTDTPIATDAALDKLAIDTIRTLSMDAVQAANSGHPGTPMALAPVAYTIYQRHLRFDPADPSWSDRDRFVLSNGHACMLLYSMLHLAGYEVSLEDLKQFRQKGSKTPGHPERGHTPGVEVTTGPLGQGIANAVGLAIAEQMLAARFNRPGHEIVDHHTIGIAGDGCLMEGVSFEACALAGRQKLGKLIFFYDDNKITIAGSTALAFTEDVARRFEAMEWQTLRVDDANDTAAIDRALIEAKGDTARPTLILLRSHIGYGSPKKQDTKEAHGEPLGDDEVKAAKRFYGWPEDAKFLVPDDVRGQQDAWRDRGKKWSSEWRERFAAYRQAYPLEAAEFERVMAGRAPDGLDAALAPLRESPKAEASRESGAKAIQALAAAAPELVGGSADLDPSTKTFINASVNFDFDRRDGRNIQFGVREHGMGSIVNGMAAHGGLRPFGATFFVFSDYMRPTIRLAALSKLPSIFVFTHDSVGLGEDGPTHQPIEHLASLRAIPGVHVFRPADARETAEAWAAAIQRMDGPTLLVLSRQKLPVIDRERAGAGASEGALRGGYVALEAAGARQVTLIATGSEVGPCIEAAGLLQQEGVTIRVVSLASWEVFALQQASYREAVLGPADGVRISVEAGATMGWDRYTNPRGASIGIDRFGASAPGPTNMESFGFTPVAIAERVRNVVRESH